RGETCTAPCDSRSIPLAPVSANSFPRPAPAWSITSTRNWCARWRRKMRSCLAKIIPDRWYKGLAVLTVCFASPSWAAGDLAALVHAYREAPAPAKHTAILSYAGAHPKEAAVANLALGIAAFEDKDYTAALAALKRAAV